MDEVSYAFLLRTEKINFVNEVKAKLKEEYPDREKGDYHFFQGMDEAVKVMEEISRKEIRR